MCVVSVPVSARAEKREAAILVYIQSKETSQVLSSHMLFKKPDTQIFLRENRFLERHSRMGSTGCWSTHDMLGAKPSKYTLYLLCAFMFLPRREVMNFSE